MGTVIVVGLSAGLGLARAAIGSEPPRSEASATSAGGREDHLGASAEAAREAEAAPEERPIAIPEVADVAPALEADGLPAEVVAEVVPPEVVAPASPTPSIPTVAATPTPGTPRAWSRVVHGRIAYLRCVGAPAAEGEPSAECPRDELLEATVWAAVDGLVDCPTAPPGLGEVDLVVDVGAGAPPDVHTRDRFAADVVRLDGAAVTACVAPPLATVSSSIGAARVVVSFRFRVAP